jgi:hypothetical protein
MAPLLAARRKHLAATFGLHAHAKAMCLGAAAFARLVCALWQSNPPLVPEFAWFFSLVPLDRFVTVRCAIAKRYTGRVSGRAAIH